jgi:uncharacterized protein
MVAHSHGNIWSAADPARSLGIGESTIRRYLDILTDLFLVRQLHPFHANLAKRQVKAPKVFLRDPGLLHGLLGIRTAKDLLLHPKCGASWEGYLIEELQNSLKPDEMFFWATHNGAELDLLIKRHGKWYGFEIKRTDAPKLTPSMRSALADLPLHKLFVVYPGSQRFPLADRVIAIPAVDAAIGLPRDFGPGS